MHKGDIICVSDDNIITKCCNKIYHSVGYGSVVVVALQCVMSLFTFASLIIMLLCLASCDVQF